MKLIVNNNGEILELDGIIRSTNNQFYAEISVPNEIQLNPVINTIKGIYNFRGMVTLVNNKNTYTRTSESNPNEDIYVYEAGYMISGDVDEKNILISSFLIYFKELDRFFVHDKYKINIENLDRELTITQKYCGETLFEDEIMSIEYQKTAGIDHDLAGHTIFLTPSKLNISFKHPKQLSEIFEEISKIEKVLGFVLSRKMNLLEVIVYDENDSKHDLVLRYQKEFNDISLEAFHIVDLNSKQLLKEIMQKYYSDNKIAGAINMFYEYIYNDLDSVFEFTSLVNTIEMIMSHEDYKELIEKYAVDNNEQLQINNLRMNEISKKLSKDEISFIKSFYRFKNVELRDKIKYIYYKIFELKEYENSDNYFSKIINTRNYFVHGTKSNNLLDSFELEETKFLLKNILYVLIVKTCSNETNIIVERYKDIIPEVYEETIILLDKSKIEGTE